MQEICKVLGIKKSLVYKTLQYVCRYGTAYNLLARHAGRQRVLTGTVVDYLQALLAERPCLFVDEIQHDLAMTQGVAVSLTTLVRTLRHIH